MLSAILGCILSLGLLTCSSDISPREQNVYPWCIVAFDSLERSPAERISMLKDFGFDRYGYDCDIRYLDDMEEELQLASANDIEVTSVWFWLNAKRDSIHKLSPRNQRILEIVSRSDHKPEFWVSFSPNFFKDLDKEASLDLSIAMLKAIHEEVDKIGCKIRIYNHKGWFGDIDNMVKIIESAPEMNLKMVYNFHHGHGDIGDFARVAQKISPHLSSVNLNGMQIEGPKILTLGAGNHEHEMIQLLKANNYHGPWGILGHIKDRDVKEVLTENLQGFKSLEMHTP